MVTPIASGLGISFTSLGVPYRRRLQRMLDPTAHAFGPLARIRGGGVVHADKMWVRGLQLDVSSR